MVDIKIESEPFFDSFKVLYVIENNPVMDDIFRDGDNNLSYAMLRTMAKNNTLNENILGNLKEMFDRIILKNEGPLNEYLSYTDVKIKKYENKLPKHYGKKQILEDIKENDNYKTELDRAMLALNDLRNMYSKLKNRGIKDKKQGTNYLNKEACRDIIASVRIIENKLAHILKKN
jgi:hypothetical protein